MRHHGDALLPHGRRKVAAHIQILDASVRHQLRRRRGDGAYPRIRVRHQLVELFLLRRRHIRCAARHRGYHGVLHGGDVRRRNARRLGQGVETIPPRLDMARGNQRQSLGSMDSHRQRMDGVSGRHGVQHRHGAQRDVLVLGRCAVAVRPQQIRPLRNVGIRNRSGIRHGCVGLVSAAPPPYRRGFAKHQDSRRVRNPVAAGLHLHGRRFGGTRNQTPADETRRHGGSLRRQRGCAAGRIRSAAPRERTHERR